MTSAYKGSLTVGGPVSDKAKLQLRRPTPDSDVLASSDEEPVRPPIRQTYSGSRRLSSSWLNDIQPTRKNSLPAVSFPDSQPSTPSSEPGQRAATSSFAWNTNSFGSTQSGSRLREVVVPSPTSAFTPTDRSPTTIDTDNGIGFLLNQQQHQPLRKAVRSQSYSIGQGDIEASPVGKFSANLRSNVRHKPSRPSLLGESSGPGLSQLREDEADEIESSNGSEHGVRLPAGYWEREQKQALLKQAAMENARTRNRATSASSPVVQHPRKMTAGMRTASYTTDYAIEELDDSETSTIHPSLSLTRRFSEHVSVLPRDHEVEIVDSPKKQQWATDNIAMLGTDALGRRHSFAHYGAHSHNLAYPTLSNTQEEDEEVALGRQGSQSPEQIDQFDAAAYFAGYGPASRAINASAISAAHPDPIVPNTAMSSGNPYAVPNVFGRPGRRLFVVTFKCSRADIYYLHDNTGLEIRRGDLVIVEGDRGCDLGQVTQADVSLEDAKKYKAIANEEHFRWLVMFSQYSIAGTSNDSGMLGSLARANGVPNAMAGPHTNTVGAPADQDAKPKMIKRLAQQHEIMKLRDKEGDEAKAKRVGAQKAADHRLPMEILDAEYQADHHKLTYYYYADSYVNFNELVTDLFKQYKVRIWMSAVNPASVVNPAGMMQVQPPSAIGPGAILHSNAAYGGSSLAVGPGFGSGFSTGHNNHRGQHGQHGRGRQQAAQGSYEDGYNAFSYQLPSYNSQANYNMSPWTAHGQQMYMQPGSYPSATASGSPMNYNGYYPPSTYGASSSGTAYRGGYSSANTQGGSQAYTTTAGSSYGQYSTAPSYNNPNANSGTSGGYGNGYTATSGASYNPAFDPALMAGLQNMGISK
ncbi:PSP1-domain-containing protein [Ophiobolus disseminans]|uniref:PSP1-domain-containing protein n=1 Tax=Ophiobolus disseminans TaxID=1469910 RepID=A0A6A7ABS4_9PLEO|nr:PSP1-domain-containing protein [Ophiobolus disseminans]